jgi:pyrimidine-nucleoside phosphorylase
MNAAHIIASKRDGNPLNVSEITAFISGYVDGSIPDYQMAALAMAVYFQGMDLTETTVLTEQMLHSGTILEWTAGGPPKVDKHSTGGVGDKVSLVLTPLLACCDLHVPMISGRGLGATGGTLDKLESILGFRTDLSIAEIRRLTEQVGCVITGATSNLVPADRQLYALRDVTATVPSIPLITASILSKKLAEGLDALVLDVKFGSGAFMKTVEGARELATSLVQVGTNLGLRVVAMLCDMNQPLGRMVGNSVEVQESIHALEGEGPADLIETVIELGAELLLLTDQASDRELARGTLRSRIDTGHARERFDRMIVAQGGDPKATLDVADESVVESDRAGYVVTMNTAAIGKAIIELGGGRRKKGDRIDHSVGIEMLVRLGDRVEVGQPLARVFARPECATTARSCLSAAIHIADKSPSPAPLILGRIGPDQ